MVKQLNFINSPEKRNNMSPYKSNYLIPSSKFSKHFKVSEYHNWDYYSQKE